MPSGLLYLNSSDLFTSNKRGVWIGCIIIAIFYSNSCIKCKGCRPRPDAALRRPIRVHTVCLVITLVHSIHTEFVIRGAHRNSSWKCLREIDNNMILSLSLSLSLSLILCYWLKIIYLYTCMHIYIFLRHESRNKGMKHS